MKKIKNYLFAVIAMMIVFFSVNGNLVEAEENTEVLDKVVINPNSSQGKPTNVFTVVETIPPAEEGGEPTQITKQVQFTRVRNITIAINLDEAEQALYDDKYEICQVIPAGSGGSVREQEVCTTAHSISKKQTKVQLQGEDDGEKTLRIYFFNVNNTEHSKVRDCVKIEKVICLDSTGPVITMTGGEYVFIPLGSTYIEAGATCEDNGMYVSGSCTVTGETPNIDMSKKGYQYIKYTATDFLGNETNVLRKVMVEQKSEEVDYKSWFIGGGAVLIVALAVGYKVIKDKEKNKNQSVL